MRVRVETSRLREAVGLARRAVKATKLPVLEHVLLRTNGAGLEVTATDLTSWIACRVQCEVEEPGQLTLPAKRLDELLGAIGAAQLTIAASAATAGAMTATLEAAYGTATLAGFEAAEFPPLPAVEGPAMHVRGSGLLGALVRVLPSAAPDDSRPVLAGCLVQMVEGKLEMVTADGFRLARTALPILGADLEPPDPAIVPAGSLALAKAFLPKKGDEAVTLRIGAGAIALELGRVRLVSTTIEGQYPDFKRIVPSGCAMTATLESDGLERAARAIAAGLGEKEPIVCLAIERDRAIVSGKGYERASLAFTLPARVEPAGSTTSIAFNGKFLTDALAALGAERVALGVNASDSPGLFRAAGGRSAESYVVVMPMHVAK